MNDDTFSESLDDLEKLLKYKFKNQELLEQAVTHRSLSIGKDYERFEFLGDAVLDLVIAHLLLNYYPTSKEGDLSKMRAALVNTESLSEIALNCEMHKFIRLSKSEQAHEGSKRPALLADVFEAVIGAIYKESGYDSVFKVVENLFSEPLKVVNPRDPKTELQELLHLKGIEAPIYLLEMTEGPEHAPTFISVVKIDGEVLGRGEGATKKASQQAAAAVALEKLSKERENDN